MVLLVHMHKVSLLKQAAVILKHFLVNTFLSPLISFTSLSRDQTAITGPPERSLENVLNMILALIHN